MTPVERIGNALGLLAVIAIPVLVIGVAVIYATRPPEEEQPPPPSAGRPPEQGG
jgi:hypothetical protein